MDILDHDLKSQIEGLEKENNDAAPEDHAGLTARAHRIFRTAGTRYGDIPLPECPHCVQVGASPDVTGLRLPEESRCPMPKMGEPRGMPVMPRSRARPRRHPHLSGRERPGAVSPDLSAASSAPDSCFLTCPGISAAINAPYIELGSGSVESEVVMLLGHLVPPERDHACASCSACLCGPSGDWSGEA